MRVPPNAIGRKRYSMDPDLKPLIVRTYRTWRLHPDMTFALVEDTRARLWVLQKCPAGAHLWTPQQARKLPGGAPTRRAIREVLQTVRALTRPSASGRPSEGRTAQKSRPAPSGTGLHLPSGTPDHS